MGTDPIRAVYGVPPRELAERDPAAVQTSPLEPGSTPLENLAPQSLAAAVVAAPPGTVERRYALAAALKALAPDGVLTAMAPKDKGGSRLKKELTAFGCRVEESARRHFRICAAAGQADTAALEQALAEGAPRLDEALGLWTQPGVFSWDRIDPGSQLLADHLPALSGNGADLGCGVGYLALKVLASPAVKSLALVDIDRRAVEAARRNVTDPRAAFHWADVLDGEPPLAGLDFVVMNPPFHAAGQEDRDIGSRFIRRASAILAPGGALWTVANRHLPYEAALKAGFKRTRLVVETGAYKVHEAIR